MQNDNQVDLLQIRIENAKAKLPVETINAIAAVDWKAAILSLREKRGYNFEQLGDLELETELVLCGLTDPADYPKELEARMRLSKAETTELVEEMNTLVFKKIKEELIKNSERKKIFQKSAEKNETKELDTGKIDTTILKKAGIEIENRDDLLKKVENPAPTPIPKISPIFVDKLSTSVQNKMVKTEHTLENISSVDKKIVPPKNKLPTADPYREIPE